MRDWFQTWYNSGGRWQFAGWLFKTYDEAQWLANELVQLSMLTGRPVTPWMIADHPAQSPVHDLMRWQQ